MRKHLLPGIVALGLLLFGAVTGACKNSSGEPFSLEDYFQQVDDADEKAGLALSAVDEDVGDTDDVQVYKDAFPRIQEIVGSFIDDLDALEPPAEAGVAHQAVIDNARRYSGELANVIESVQDIETLDEFYQATDGVAFTRANDALAQACAGMEELAAASDVTLELECTQEPE